MNYGTIKNCDIANGEGVRVSLFVSGCTHHCHNCFNPETWSFSYGSPFDEQAQSKLLTLLSPDYIDGLSLLGGEPFEPDNQRALVPFLKKVRAQYPGSMSSLMGNLSRLRKTSALHSAAPKISA